MALGIGSSALPRVDNRTPQFVWNASANVPIDLYAVDTSSTFTPAICLL
jgi:type IV secretory pathway protease TraF